MAKPPNRARSALSVPTAIFGVWLVSLAGLLYLGSAFAGHHIDLSALLAKWDGGWYQSISAGGYHYIAGAQSNVAFFPLFPLLAKALSLGGIPLAIAGLLVSLAAFWGTLVLLYQLTTERFDQATAKIACALLAFFPFSFFFGLFYTESTFAFLVVLTLLLTQRRQWWWAALATALAASTRFIGIFLALVVVGSYLQQRPRPSWPQALTKAVGLVAISSVGLLGFMAYLQATTHNAFAFVAAQRYWPGRSNGLAGLRLEAHNLHHNTLYSNPAALNLTELVCLALFIGLTVYCWFRVNRWWALFCALALAVPLATGTTISTNRYVLVLAPGFIALARLLKTPERAMLLLAPLALLLAFYFNLYYTTGIFLG